MILDYCLFVFVCLCVLTGIKKQNLKRGQYLILVYNDMQQHANGAATFERAYEKWTKKRMLVACSLSFTNSTYQSVRGLSYH